MSENLQKENTYLKEQVALQAQEIERLKNKVIQLEYQLKQKNEESREDWYSLPESFDFPTLYCL
jgi:predicted nuclease with TOPRIM domain